MNEDILEHLEKVYEGCDMHMNQLDNDGYCAESDEYVVALHFVREYIESLKEKSWRLSVIPVECHLWNNN